MRGNPYMGRMGAMGAAAGAPASVPGAQPETTGSLAILDPQVDGADYYFYQTNPGSLAHGATGSSNIQIDAGTDFLWIATTYQADSSGASQEISTLVVPLVTLQIQDTGASKNLQSGPVPLNCIAGTGEFPYRLIRPRLVRANSVLNFTWTSYEAATNYSNIYFIMHGIRTIAGQFG